MNRQPRILRWTNTLCALILLLAFTFWPAQAAIPLEPPAGEGGAEIRLHAASFDPLREEIDRSLEDVSTAQPDSPATYLVQFVGPVQETWKTAVEVSGARLYGYVPDYTFITRMDAATMEQIEALSFVRWVGPYRPAYRLAPQLQTGSTLSQRSTPITVSVQTLPDADLNALVREIASWGGKIQGQAMNDLAGYLHITLPSTRLDQLAAEDGVLWVEPYFEPWLSNDVGGGEIMRGDEVRADLGLYGSGQTVAVADTGLDTGNLDTLHTDVRGHVIQTYALGRPGDWSDPDSHGTHVAGSVLGNGTRSGSNPAGHQYNGSFAGLAPEANLVFQSIMDAQGGLGGIPSDRGDLMRAAYNDGARIHTNSWGGPTGGTQQNPAYGGYVISSQQVDQAMWEHPDLLILFAAGNEGVDANGDGIIDWDSINQPGTAKNVITVGASENERTSGGYSTHTWGVFGARYPVPPISNDLTSNNANGMAAFSSRGPTDDLRIKPDLVAPGTNVVSVRSQHPAAGQGWGVYDADYLYMGGTSMATPLTAGGAALVREWLTEQQALASPSAALMKAVLINGTADLHPGQYGTGGTQEIPNFRPDPVMGWGRVDLVESLNPPGPRQIWFTDESTGLATGGSSVYTLTLGTASLQATDAKLSDDDLDNTRTVTTPPSATQLSATPRDAQPFTGPSPFQMLGTTQLLQNPGFESGSWTPWQTYGTPYLTNIIKHSGTYAAHMGNSNNADDESWQEVDIPADATDVTLDFWYRLRTDETYTNADYFCVGIWDQSGSLAYVQRCLDLGAAGDLDWTQETYSLDATELASVAGETILFGFFVQTDFSLSSRAWVDDTALNVTTGGGAEPTLEITPASGPRGTTYSVTGSNFNVNDTVTIAIDGNDQFDTGSDGSGNISFDLTPPGTETQGVHTVTATDTGGHEAEDTFEIVPQVTVEVTPDSGAPGDSFNISGSGFHGGSIITIKLDSNNDGTTTANADGDFNYTLSTDAGISDGEHTVSAVDDETSMGADTFTITNPTERRVSITPASGPNGTEFTITGNNFTADASVTLKVDGATIKSVTADGDGDISTTYTPTSLAATQHTLTANDGDGQAQTTFTITTGSGGPFRVTLAWTDYPGSPTAAKALVNDLDLEIIAPDGTHYYGNSGIYSGDQCVRDSTWDTCNNVEGIILPDADYGTYTVIVHGYNVPQGPQPFAVVATGDGLRTGNPSPDREVSISPTSGPNGTTFTITGSNFTPNADVTLKVDGATIKTIPADGSGAFSTTYTPTGLSAEQHTLTAQDGNGQAQTNFQITRQYLIYLPLVVK